MWYVSEIKQQTMYEKSKMDLKKRDVIIVASNLS
jgi:hypothetical protein